MVAAAIEQQQLELRAVQAVVRSIIMPYIAPRGSEVPDAAAGSTLQTTQQLQQPLVADVESLQPSQGLSQSVDISLTGRNVDMELQRIYMMLRSVRNILAWLPGTDPDASYCCVLLCGRGDEPIQRQLTVVVRSCCVSRPSAELRVSICAPCVSPPCYHKDAQPGASMDDTCERCGAW